MLPTVPSYDPWSWIVWGKEVTDPHLSFVVSGGPSWKPLPFLFTTIYGPFDSAAPTLWVITARIGGLLGLWAAWRLASRLIGGGWPGAIAGALAVIGVVLTQDWFYYFLRGTSEVVLIGVTLWAIDRLLDGHKRRRTCWHARGADPPRMVAVHLPLRAVVVVPRAGVQDPKMRVLLLAGLFAQPFFWFVPPWVGSGDPFLAATHAADYNGHRGRTRSAP